MVLFLVGKNLNKDEKGLQLEKKNISTHPRARVCFSVSALINFINLNNKAPLNERVTIDMRHVGGHHHKVISKY